MIHPLFRLLVSEPQLLADHVEAYSELVAAEVGAVTTQLKRRAMLHGLSVVLLVLGTFFAGIAVMLWAVIPTDSMNHPLVLWATPVIPLVMAVWAHFAARAPVAEHGTQTIREQLAADAAMLRSVSAS
jgi:hypothetical protein